MRKQRISIGNHEKASLSVGEKKKNQEYQNINYPIYTFMYKNTIAVFGLTLEYVAKTSSLIECCVGVGNLFTYIMIGGLVLILKGGLGACPHIIIENNTEMHHKTNW